MADPKRAPWPISILCLILATMCQAESARQDDRLGASTQVSKETSPGQESAPPRPVVSVPAKRVAGQRIPLHFQLTPTEWKRVFKEDDWPYYVRLNDTLHRSRTSFEPFGRQDHSRYLDVAELIRTGRNKRYEFDPGMYRVALVLLDVAMLDPADPGTPVHFDAFSTNEVKFEIVPEDSAEARLLRQGTSYEGKTIPEWLDELSSLDFRTRQGVPSMLARIGRPAIPALMQLMEMNDPRGRYAAEALGKMGEDAQEVLGSLLEMARSPQSTNNTRSFIVRGLQHAQWAAAEIVPVLATMAVDPAEDKGLRRTATFALGSLGLPAKTALLQLMKVQDAQQRMWATGALERVVVDGGEKTRPQYYIDLIEANPFDENVPNYLTRTKDGAISNGYVGKSHPLSQKIKGIYREELGENPNPQVAMNLARIIQTQLANTALQWSVNSSRGSGKPWMREDPAESFVTLAEVLQLGFKQAEPETEMWRSFGTALAKFYLLRGDWEGMNNVLLQLGQEPIPREERPWLHAPPTDWSKLRARWQRADPSLRSGTCSLILRFELQGKGLPGIHVLVKYPPKPTSMYRSGVRSDTLFYSPYPLRTDHRASFGYKYDRDRSQTRYAVSDVSGRVRLDRLPETRVLLEVLIPTGNFEAAGRGWDVLMETDPGHLRRLSQGGDREALWPHESVAQITLESGKTFFYPKLVVRPQMSVGLNIAQWDAIDPQDFALRWYGPWENAATYEVEMILSAPAETPSVPERAPVLRRASATTRQTSWPVGEKGVDGLRLAPGNIYQFEVQARGENNQVLSRLPRTTVWAPWPDQETDSPVRHMDMVTQSPIHQGVYKRGSYQGHLPGGKEETLNQRLDRFLQDYPKAFERNYARVGHAWLTWHGGNKAAARRELLELIGELPEGNVARHTATHLLSRLDEGLAPPPRLDFTAGEE